MKNQKEKTCNFLTFSGDDDIKYISEDIIDIMKKIREEFDKKEIKAVIISFVKEDKSFVF